MFIDGQLVSARCRIQVTSPYDGRIAGEVSSDHEDQVAAAVTWVATCGDRPDHVQRAAVLRNTAGLITARAEEFARLITSESGVCLRETRKEVIRACANLTVAAEEAARIRGETHDLVAGGKRRLAITMHEAAGVVAAITPFNRPLNQVVVKVAPAIAAGNRVVLKPSEKTPLTALEFARALIEAGLPPGMLAVLTGPPAVIGPALAGHPLVDMVTFTGSYETGRTVAAFAAGKKVMLELGGNDSLIVLADADLDVAARLAADGAYATAGQSCRGVKRVIAAEQIADELADRLTLAAKKLTAGDPFDPLTDVGPLISEDAAAEVERRCAAAVGAGARLLIGGERVGALLNPAVLDHVPADAELVVRETFGPVAPVIRVRDASEAVAVANSTPYGLQAGVVTASAADFLRLARDLQVGAVNLMEGPNFDSPHIPFGGVKHSGVGREGIRYSIREMSTVKTVTLPWDGDIQ
jgi:putative phosphonoacetaldehyde dehydrogenase